MRGADWTKWLAKQKDPRSVVLKKYLLEKRRLDNDRRAKTRAVEENETALGLR